MRFSDALTYTFVICFFSSTICEKTTRARRYNITEDLLPSNDETYLDKKKKKKILVSTKTIQHDIPNVRLIFEIKKNKIYLIKR